MSSMGARAVDERYFFSKKKDMQARERICSVDRWLDKRA